MKNIENFFSHLKESILNNQTDYIDKIIDTLIQNENNYRAVAFRDVFYKYPNDFFDLNFAVNKLLEARKDRYFFHIIDPEIYIRFDCNPTMTYEQSLEFYEKINIKPELENRDFYLKIDDKKRQYEELSNFRLFQDVILSDEEVQKYIGGRTELIEVNNWCKYCSGVISLFYPEYAYNKKFSVKGYKRYTKQITENISLMLQYEEYNLKSSLHSGNLETPAIKLNIIIIIKDDSKKNNLLTDYTCIDLGSASNDFFNPPVIPPKQLYSRNSVVKIKEGEYEIKSYIKKQKVDDLRTRIYHDCPFEEDLKFQLFFYFDLYSYFSKIYLNFIEECILKIESS